MIHAWPSDQAVHLDSISNEIFGLKLEIENAMQAQDSFTPLYLAPVLIIL